LNLEEEITRACSEDMSGSVTLDHLVCAKPVQVQLEELALPDLAAVATWYIWGQLRQIVKGEPVQSPDRTAMAIKVLATNYSRASTAKYKAKSKHKWVKPLRAC
jgi:hypothetical protein